MDQKEKELVGDEQETAVGVVRAPGVAYIKSQ